MFFVNANLTATDKLDFFVEGVIAMSQGSFTPFNLPEPEGIPADVHISPDHAGASKGAYDFSGIGDYSDLDYNQLEGTLGANYKLDKRAKLYASVNLLDLQDDQPYVYGDLTGSIITYAAGMTVGF
ncbi:MAG: hypothetical protein GY838_01850 [bacterium]|nr:hypothetical protein [bacterium]